jgi:hypothetical protein
MQGLAPWSPKPYVKPPGLRWRLETDTTVSSGITRIHSNAWCHLHHIRGWCESRCPYIITLKGLLSDKVIAGSNTLPTANACAYSAFQRCPSQLKCTHSCSFLLAISTQGCSTSFDTSSYHHSSAPPNLSSDSCSLIQHMAQSQRHLAPISANEKENMAFRFLASLVNSPSWQDTISFANDHNQTLAHLAVLFRYTALLEKLVEWGMNLDVQDLNGFTALHCAYLCEDWECVRLLRCAGADEDLEDNLGRLPVDIYSPSIGHTRASTPSSDGTSSPPRILSEEEDWESVPRTALQASSFEEAGIVKGQPGPEAHTSNSHSKGTPLVVSLSSPSSDASNDSWIQSFDEKVQILDSPTGPTSSAPLQSRQVGQPSRVNQHATHYPPATSASTGPFHLHESTREPAPARHPSPGTPVSDLTSSLPLSEAGLPFQRLMNHRGGSGSDLSSAYPPSHCTSPMSTPSPMPPETPLQSSWSYHSPQMHRPDSSASYHQNMLHAASEAKGQRPHWPSPSLSHASMRYDPPSHPPPHWLRFGAITPYLDEKSQKETVDERKVLTGSSHLAPPPFPPPVHESGYAHAQQSKVEKNKNQYKKDDIRERETTHTQGNASWMSAEKEKDRHVRRSAERELTPVDGHGQAKGHVNSQQRGRQHYTQHRNS